MNARHLGAFLWLRWRLGVNRMRRGGLTNRVLLVIVCALVAALGAFLFAGSLLVGLLVADDVEPPVVTYLWDGVVFTFLFFWLIGLFADLHRTDPLTLDRFLHLPVSPAGAFLVNYLSSLANVTLALFLCVTGGLAIGLVASRGAALLVLFPLVAALTLALTALTYQFQGWLAALMSNPRRRRTVVVLATLVFLVLSQLPNILTLTASRDQRQDVLTDQFHAEQGSLAQQFMARKLTPVEYQRRLEALQRDFRERTADAKRQRQARLERTVGLINLLFPPGWLAIGAGAAARGDLLPGLLGTLGLGLVGGVSLWRAYRTTLQIYTGQFTSGAKRPRPDAATSPVLRPSPGGSPGLLERRLPWLPEQASAVALSGLAALLRAPEAKLLMLTPLIFAAIFGSMLFTRGSAVPEAARPLLPFAAMAMTLVGVQQMAANQFGFDRAGFRVFVLCPAPRRDILLGKNLALAPVPLGWGLVLLAGLQWFAPMRLDHLLAAVPLLVSMYLLFSLVGNWLSIYAPVPVAPGGFKPANTRLVPVLLNVAAFLLLPVVLGPLLVPLAIEMAAEGLGLKGVPVHLLLSLAVCGLVALLYWVVLEWQGQLLQAREKRILKVVTSTE